jgi:hypothetical protein
LQVLTEAVVNGERDNQRCHPSGHSKDRNARNHADESLPAFRAEIAGCNEEFEAHGEAAVSNQPSAFSQSGL